MGAILALACILAVQFVLGGVAWAGCPYADSSYVTVTFDRVFTGTYRNGQPYDVVTADPGGGGETVAGTGITIRVYLRNAAGAPLPGVPAEEIYVYSNDLSLCPGGTIADHASDANGMTTISGTLRAGGCATSLIVWASCVAVGTIPVKVNSPDAVPASPRSVDAGDVAALATRLGAEVDQPQYSICLDFNEDGSIDAADLAYFAAALGGGCSHP